ncbi:hypothetical protein [Streptomyces sp. NPDC127084]|uniref:hypothetical protein n=1 Tax=Streptomyces sp. NPDC127084 TaxID=3347133 RepID=UPI0036674D0B
MTDTLNTPQPTTPAHHTHPFTRDPKQWEKERSRALRTGHVRDHTCPATCEPVLVHERTPWVWLAWTVPGDGSPPEIPHQIGVLTPAATRTQRLAPRWLTRRPAHRIALGTVPGSLRLATAAIALISLLAGLFAIHQGIPVDVVLPAAFLAPLVAEHLPDRLDARARKYVRVVEGDVACRYLQRLATLHTSLVHAAADSGCYELRRSADIGQTLLWEAAGLLQNRDSRSVSADLIARERAMLQLAHIVKRTAQGDTACASHASHPGRHCL